MVVVGDDNFPVFETVAQQTGGFSIGKIFLSNIHSNPDSCFLKYRKYGSFRNVSRIETFYSMNALYYVFTKLGLKKGDRVLFVSENRQQLVTSMLCAVSAGFVAVPVHNKHTFGQIQEITRNAKPKCIVISDETQLDKLEKIDDIPNIPVITFDKISNELFFYKDIVKKYRSIVSDYNTAISNVSCDDPAYIFYTSDEFGKLVGAKLTHKNVLSSVEQFLEEIVDLSENDICLSYLPVSSVYGCITEFHSILQCGGAFTIADNTELSTIIENIREVQATVLYADPQVWEELYEKFSLIECNGEQSFDFATGGTLRKGFCVGGLLEDNVIEYFKKLNLPIYQFYGHTQTGGVVAVKAENSELSEESNTSWKILKNTKVKVTKDGEILIQGDPVSSGYFGQSIVNPDFMMEGWFKTGDLGALDESGYLRKIVRKKEIITLLNGHRISPLKIENMIESQFIDKAVIVGEGKKFLAALISPNIKNLRKYAEKELKIEDSSIEELFNNRWIRAAFKLVLENVNEELPDFEMVKKFTLLTTPLSTESMELTPNGYPIRSVIRIKRKSEIESIYNTPFSKRFI